MQVAGFYAGIGAPGQLTPSHTFDNLDQDGPGGPDQDSTNAAWNLLHIPASPAGMGPHSALTGLAFGGAPLGNPSYQQPTLEILVEEAGQPLRDPGWNP